MNAQGNVSAFKNPPTHPTNTLTRFTIGGLIVMYLIIRTANKTKTTTKKLDVVFCLGVSEEESI
jgi:hypothetical protein